MKLLDRIAVILFTICIILASVLIPVTIISTRDTYYRNQLKKCGIYPNDNETTVIRYIGGDSSKSAAFTSEQFDDIISHITDFLANKKQSFALQMNEINLNGETVDKVDIFGEEAVTHMDDVRPVFSAAKTVLFVCISLLIICGVYMFTRKNTVRKIIYKYSLGVVIGFFGAFALFFGVVLVKHLINGSGTYFDTLWSDMHHIFFPLASDKFQGSFFNDTLTYILTLDFFMNTVFTVIVNIIALTAAWLFSAKLISRR